MSGIFTSLFLFLGASGVALFLLRQNFKNDEIEALPKMKIKPKAKLKTQSNALPKSTPQQLSIEVPPELPFLPEPMVESRAETAVTAEEEVPPTLPILSELGQAPVSSVQTYYTTSVHVAIWPYDRVLEMLNPDHAFEALSEFQSIGISWAEKHQLIYERSTGGSFYLHWIDEVAAPGALKCALDLKQEFTEWNDVRKAQGYAPVIVVMGADRGFAMRGLVGPETCRHESIVGEVIARARALAQIALSLQSSVLSSEELWTTVSHRYLGERVSDAHLTALGSAISCYKVTGYIGENGQEVWMKDSEPKPDPESCQIDAPRIEKNEQSPMWRVNNGSQILGPMSPQDVARALYSLEIDFDCECWQEGSTLRMPIEKSGMFGEEKENDAHLWVFDGDTIHGPLTEAFLKTEMGRKAFSRDSYVCEKSTVLGWKPLMELRASLSEVSEVSEVSDVTDVTDVTDIDFVAPPAFEPEVGPTFVALTDLKPIEEVEECLEPVAEEPALVAPPAPIELPILMPVLEVVDRPTKKSA